VKRLVAWARLELRREVKGLRSGKILPTHDIVMKESDGVDYSNV
jgi:hypothetical protein